MVYSRLNFCHLQQVLQTLQVEVADPDTPVHRHDFIPGSPQLKREHSLGKPCFLDLLELRPIRLQVLDGRGVVDKIEVNLFHTQLRTRCENGYAGELLLTYVLQTILNSLGDGSEAGPFRGDEEIGTVKSALANSASNAILCLVP